MTLAGAGPDFFCWLARLGSLLTSARFAGLFCHIVVKYQEHLLELSNEALASQVVSMLELVVSGRHLLHADCLDVAHAVVAAVTFGPVVQHWPGVI